MPPLGNVPPLQESSAGALAPMQRVVTVLGLQDYLQDVAFFPREQDAESVGCLSPRLGTVISPSH
jgi:hypothetical protein